MADGPHSRSGEKTVTVRGMSFSEALRDQHLDCLSQQIISRVSKQFLDL
jgi:hypothetical protein